MAKNSQYGRWRAVALQAVMWVILGSSLGVAAFIDRRHSGSLDVQFGDPVVAGRLVVRLPRGWDLETETAADEGPLLTLTLKDFDRQGRLRRTLRITQEQQGGRAKGPEYYLEDRMSARHLVPLEAQPFSMLGQDDAVVVPFKVDLRRIRRVLEEQGASIDLPEPGLYACAVLPDGLAVTVQVTGDGAYGPSARRLLQRVADNIKVADGAADKRRESGSRD